MFGGEDPFGGMFRNMHRQMRDMDRMMDAMMGDPFGGMMGRSPFGMLEDSRPRTSTAQRQVAHPMDSFGFGLGGFGNLFQTMGELQNRAMSDPNSHMFAQSTMITFGPDGNPRVVENSVRKSGDVKETRRNVRDGELEEMSIGHTIGDRTHIIEKKRDKDGKVRRQQKFMNLDEDEAEDFDREFHSRARYNLNGGRHSGRRDIAIEGGPGGSGTSSSSRRGDRYARSTGSEVASGSRAGGSSAPIITLPDEEDDEPVPTSSSRGGPVIREISEEEAEQSIPKRRRNPFGGFYRANDE